MVRTLKSLGSGAVAGALSRSELDWIGLDWIGLDWIGLDWIGLDWIGLDWIGLDWIEYRVGTI